MLAFALAFVLLAASRLGFGNFFISAFSCRNNKNIAASAAKCTQKLWNERKQAEIVLLF